MKCIKNSLLVVLLSILTMFWQASASPASTFDFTFSGTANFTTAPNTLFSGSFIYDTTTLPDFPGSVNYPALTQGNINIFGSSHSINLTTSSISIINDFMGTDQMNIWLHFPQDIPIPGDEHFNIVRVLLQDTTGVMFSNSMFPQDLSFLDHVDYKRIDFLSADPPQFTLIPKALTEAVSIAPVAPVPEPTTMLLLSSGLLGLWGARKKFKK